MMNYDLLTQPSCGFAAIGVYVSIIVACIFYAIFQISFRYHLCLLLEVITCKLSLSFFFLVAEKLL